MSDNNEKNINPDGNSSSHDEANFKGQYLTFDFSNLLYENEKTALSENDIINTAIEILEKISKINILTMIGYGLESPEDLDEKNPLYVYYLRLRDTIGSLIAFFGIKYIPGYEMRYRGQPYMMELLMLDILKNNRKIITLDVSFNYAGHYKRKFNKGLWFDDKDL